MEITEGAGAGSARERKCQRAATQGLGAAHTPGVPPGDRGGTGTSAGTRLKGLGGVGSPPNHFMGDLCIWHLPLQKVPCASHLQGFRGSPIPRAGGEPVPPVPPCSPPPSLSPPSTLKVLKVKYYRLLCCCLTTTDKLRTSCQNVSAQQINIQNESQRYVVYN